MSVALSNHFSLRSSAEVRDISLNILQLLKVDYYSYIRVFSDNSRILLTTYPEWIDYFYRTGLYQSNAIASAEHALPTGFYYWDKYSPEPAFAEGKRHFNIEKGVSIIRRNENYTDIHVLGSTSDNVTVESLACKQDLFLRFIPFFLDKANKLIAQGLNNKIIVPHGYSQNPFSVDPINLPIELKNNFYQETKVDKLFLPNGEYFSHRETHCLYHLLKGNCAKSTGKMMGISNRTVETHLENIKLKLGCNSKTEIISVLLKNNLYDIILDGLY